MEEVNDREIQILNEIFAKAAQDPEFRKMLLKETSSVLDKYEISDETKQIILEGVRGMF